MNVAVFCIGMEQTDFDGVVSMAQSICENRREFEQKIGDSDGIGMYAVGIHIIHTWIIPITKEYLIDNNPETPDILKIMDTLGAYSYFFRLARKDDSFKYFLGTVETCTSPVQKEDDMSTNCGKGGGGSV